MFNAIINLFRSKNKESLNDSEGEGTTEKKKCKRCLRRIDFEYAKCPFCGCSEFHEY